MAPGIGAESFAGRFAVHSRLTPQRIRQLLKTNVHEILRQIGYEEVRLGVSVNDSEACIQVSVKPEKVDAMPKHVSVTTERGSIDIPLKVTGDYEPFELHQVV